MKIFIASAFSKNRAGGNKAGVCLHGEVLQKQQKKAISKKLGFAETAYISTSKNDFVIEYFTPYDEVPLCGHATIASFIVMREKMLLNKNEYNIKTKSGRLVVILDGAMVFMEQNKPIFYETLTKKDMAGCFDIDVINDEAPIEIGSTGLRDIMLPIKDLATLSAMKPNFSEICALSRNFGTVGIHAFCFDDKRIICRNFAPLYDIPEESATGTSNCVLASYLWKNNIVRKNEYIFEQGFMLNSPSEIFVRLTTSNDNIDKIMVGGEGYLIGEELINIKAFI